MVTKVVVVSWGLPSQNGIPPGPIGPGPMPPIPPGGGPPMPIPMPIIGFYYWASIKSSIYLACMCSATS